MYRISRTPAARLLGAAALSAAALASVCAAHPAAASAAGPGTAEGDHLTVTVRDAGPGFDGTYELYCHPTDGDHPDPEGACAAVEQDTRWGRDTFAPVAEGSVCTMQYGGPATARVTGIWAGRPVDATYDRRDGCEISRWDRMVPLLPELSGTARS
ncbi:SSI family serine proteinase inhibitor [Streptomyces sp. NPDC048188]|uniref:SSI family serine proteinase inhibitor n=1 Tax=Streptomyces sp. NPDC048188 TaxID=3155749 RepID=UPI00342D449D